MERRMLFSSRRSLFSDPQTPVRRKLFGESSVKKRRLLFSGVTEDIYHYTCQDCGNTFISQDHGKVYCPNCGGNRVVCSEESDRQWMIDESEKDFSDTYDATDEFLKEFSGKTVSPEDLEKIFSERGLDETPGSLLDAGYARATEDGQLCFSEHADVQRKLFSKLVISVTKELELVPVDSKEALIHKLMESGNLPVKTITLIGKAHGITPEALCCCPNRDYLEDSGIKTDLKSLYGGQVMTLPEFEGILKTQYNDAPDDILDKIASCGVIGIDGNRVTINN